VGEALSERQSSTDDQASWSFVQRTTLHSAHVGELARLTGDQSLVSDRREISPLAVRPGTSLGTVVWLSVWWGGIVEKTGVLVGSLATRLADLNVSVRTAVSSASLAGVAPSPAARPGAGLTTSMS